jgi:hypothetical protein
MDEEIKKEDSLVNDADVVTQDSSEEKLPMEAEKKKKRKTDYYVELILFLVLGILVGVAVKTEAAKTITIGFDDYKMKLQKQDYDINQLQSDLAKKNQANQSPQDQSAAPAENGGDQSGQDQGNPDLVDPNQVNLENPQ